MSFRNRCQRRRPCRRSWMPPSLYSPTSPNFAFPRAMSRKNLRCSGGQVRANARARSRASFELTHALGSAAAVPWRFREPAVSLSSHMHGFSFPVLMNATVTPMTVTLHICLVQILSILERGAWGTRRRPVPANGRMRSTIATSLGVCVLARDDSAGAAKPLGVRTLPRGTPGPRGTRCSEAAERCRCCGRGE